MFRLIGIPALAVAGVLIYRGVEDHFTLPACDSGRAKATLADVLKQLKSEPQRYEPIKTVSASKNQVVCNAILPLADGSNILSNAIIPHLAGDGNTRGGGASSP